MIPKVDCKHGYVYRIKSRNLIVGVYNSETGGFVGIREKFGSEYLFPEFHHDNGPPYGTVAPIREIEKCPVEDIRDHLDTVCRDCRQRCEWKMTDPEKKTGVWYHLAEGTCTDAKPCGPQNDALFKYLEGIENAVRRETMVEVCRKGEEGWPLCWTLKDAEALGLVTPQKVAEHFGIDMQIVRRWFASEANPDGDLAKRVYEWLIKLAQEA